MSFEYLLNVTSEFFTIREQRATKKQTSANAQISKTIGVGLLVQNYNKKAHVTHCILIKKILKNPLPSFANKIVKQLCLN